MRWIVLVVLALFAVEALALPAENHWTESSGEAAPMGNYLEAESLIDAERFEEALPLLVSLSEEQPGLADAWNLLGFAYRKTGNLARSGVAYRRALGLDPYHLEALEYQGELFLMLDDVGRAQANLARLDFLCDGGCEERDELAAAIEAWRARQEP